MSKAADNLPNLPETEVIQPILQCGVLYLGTALPTPGQRGLNSIQEPLSHRYPIDGTNTVRGIDAILSIYENGIQLVFARQAHVALFYPLASLIYCASVRYAIVEHEKSSLLDWRFVTIDAADSTQTKYPPLFATVMQRTQIQSGDECHCFITKNDDAALALVRTISEIYADLSAETKLFKSPIFYQLDRYGRRISETTGTIFLSPAKDPDRYFTTLERNDLLDPSFDGFFYRTDATMIEKWQLWDDNEPADSNRIQSRPRPPPSPFGLHQGLYHDDLSSDIHRYLRQMEDEDENDNDDGDDDENNDDENSDRTSTTSSTLSEDSQIYGRKIKNLSFARSMTSSFDPSTTVSVRPPPMNLPIIIEKVIPKPVPLPLPPPPPPPPQPIPREPMNSNGNQIIYEDVVRPKLRRPSKRVPIIDLESLSSQSSINAEIMEGFFEDHRGKTTELTGSDAESMLKQLHSSSKRHRNQNRHRHRQASHSSTIISGRASSYGQQGLAPVNHPHSIQQYISNVYGTVSSPQGFYSK